MKNGFLYSCVIGGMLSMANFAQADNVAVWGDSYPLETINSFYDNLNGHSSQIISDLTNLSGVDLLWAVQPADTYSVDEISQMTTFLNNGGRIAFMGEHGGYKPTEDSNINSALTILGSGMSINIDSIDSGYHDATVANSQILPHSLTSNVATYNYACFASLNITGNAQALMYGTTLTDVMMGYENILNGSIFLITDQNVWDNVYEGTNDNATMFENLLTGETGAGQGQPVPEPTTLVLLGAGVAALTAFGRKNTIRVSK